MITGLIQQGSTYDLLFQAAYLNPFINHIRRTLPISNCAAFPPTLIATILVQLVGVNFYIIAQDQYSN